MLDDMHIRRLVSVLDHIIWAQEGDTSKNDWEKINAAKAELNDLIQKLQELKTQLEEGVTIKITWR